VEKGTANELNLCLVWISMRSIRLSADL